MPSLRTLSIALASFAMGACAAAAATSEAQPATEAPAAAAAADAIAPVEGATVVAAADAPTLVAPSGKARVTHLARGDNAYLGRLEMDGGGAVPQHRDATEEYIHVLSGGGTITIEGTAHEIAAGTTIYMPANAEVSFQNGPDPLVAIQVFAGPAPAAKYDGWSPAS